MGYEAANNPPDEWKGNLSMTGWALLLAAAASSSARIAKRSRSKESPESRTKPKSTTAPGVS